MLLGLLEFFVNNSIFDNVTVFIVWLNVKENDLVDDYFLDILYEDICIEIDDYHEVSSKDVQQFRIYFI